MSDPRSDIARHVRLRGAAAVARQLEVSRGALLGYLSGHGREAQRIVIELRAPRLDGKPAQGQP
jgi:hypothetical protein